MLSLAKNSAAAALSWSGLDLLLGHRARELPLILGYHRVVEDVAAAEAHTLPGMSVSQRSLRAQLEWLARRFQFASLDTIGERLEQRLPCNQLAAITFDDGYRDVYEYGLPVLERLGLPAAVFVVSGSIGAHAPLVHDRLYEFVSEASAARRPLPDSLRCLLAPEARLAVDAPPFETMRALLESAPQAVLQRILDQLGVVGASSAPPHSLDAVDWHALARMQRAGIIVGSHTRTHALLSCEDDATVRDEIERSRRELESALGSKVRHFAYPDGRFSPRIVRAVAAAGYRFAYTICEHRDSTYPLLTLPRVMLWEGSCRGAFGRFSPSLLSCHASSLLPLRARCRTQHDRETWKPPC